MDFHFASAWEAIADTVPDRTALICEGVTRTWADYDGRATRVAGLLQAHGLGADTKVGLYLHNCNEYLEAQYGVFKLSGCPINVNYRYKAEELVYLLDNADAEAVFYQGCYAPRIEEIRDQLPRVKLYVQVDDGTEDLLAGSVDYESSLDAAEPMARQKRDPASVYMLYTGAPRACPRASCTPAASSATCSPPWAPGGAAWCPRRTSRPCGNTWRV